MDDNKPRLSAYVWFAGSIVAAAALTVYLARVDRQMYDSNAEFLDYTAYRQNRAAAFGLASESVDPRGKGEFSNAVEQLEGR